VPKQKDFVRANMRVKKKQKGRQQQPDSYEEYNPQEDPHLRKYQERKRVI
jgi:hypothetical protein